MSPTTSTPVTSIGPFTLLASPGDYPQVQQLYSLTSGVPERIESVFMTLFYDSDDANNDIMVVQFLDPAGLDLFQQASPLIHPPGGATAQIACTWSRLGNDDSSDTLAWHPFGFSQSLYSWFNMRVPELVLEATSTVNLLAFRDNDSETADLSVDDATVTVSRDVGDGSTTTAVTGIPLLTDVSGG